MTASLIALDWGTTSLRAYLLDATGEILETRREKSGIQQVAREKFPDALKSVTAGWPALPILMSGMIGSRQGWVEAPYAECPAGLNDIAPRLVPVPDVPNAFIVPGVALRTKDVAPDVMRGEETQILGLDLRDGSLAVLPGTHSKWTLIEGGRITWFATFMTGEVYDVLKKHSILGRQMEEVAEEGVPPGFEAGLRQALSGAEPALLRSLFSVRTRGLFGEIDAKQAPGYLSGLLIGCETREAIAATRERIKAPRVTLAGAAALCELYRHALNRAGIASSISGEESAARGLYRIAGAAGLLKR